MLRRVKQTVRQTARRQLRPPPRSSSSPVPSCTVETSIELRLEEAEQHCLNGDLMTPTLACAIPTFKCSSIFAARRFAAQTVALQFEAL